MPLKLVKPAIICFISILYLSCSEWRTKNSNTFSELQELPAVVESTTNDSIISALGEEIENYIINGNSKSYTDKFEYQYFMHRVTYVDGAGNSLEKFTKRFSDGFRKGFEAIPNRISSEVEAGGFYDFISSRYDSENKKYRMLFRLYSEETGINYHDYELIYKDEEFYIEDMYVYTTGENISESLNKVFLAGLPKNIIEKIVQFKSNNDLANLIEATTSVKEKEFEKALVYLNKINGKLKNKKIFHIIKIQAASQINDAAHLEALESLKKQFPDDASSNLMLIDYYVLKEDYPEALISLQNLQDATNDDFLNYLKANLYYEAGEIEKSIENYQNIIEGYPDYSTPHLNLLSVYTETGDYKESLNLLNRLIAADFFLPEEMINYVEETEPDGSNVLQPLVDSKDYKNWKAGLGSI